MTITYSDGRAVQGTILSRSGNLVRVALEGGADSATFTNLNGTWVGEDCEPVRMEYAWQRPVRRDVVSESDCICSKDLASRLIHLLLNGDQVALPMPLPEATHDCAMSRTAHAWSM